MNNDMNEKFVTIQGWMVNELNLKGNELMIYAIIYGFCQEENQVFYGSLNYMANWISSSKQTVIKCLKSLVDKNLIEKNEKFINNVKFCEYRSKKFNRGSQKSLIGVVKKFDQGSQKIRHNNINNNIDNNINNNKKDINKLISKKNFVKPNVDDVRKYCVERKNSVDAQKFVDFYEAKGWMIGKNKMKDWKACVRTWERKQKNERDENQAYTIL